MLLLGEKEGERATGPWLGEGNEIWGFGALNEGLTRGPEPSEPAPAAAPAVCSACQQIPG